MSLPVASCIPTHTCMYIFVHVRLPLHAFSTVAKREGLGAMLTYLGLGSQSFFSFICPLLLCHHRLIVLLLKFRYACMYMYVIITNATCMVITISHDECVTIPHDHVILL